MPVDPQIANYEIEVKIQLHRDYFWVVGDYAILSYGWVCLNINYISMGICTCLYIIADTLRIRSRFEDIIMDYILLVLLFYISTGVYNFNREKFSK
jgi:hypothetical protein